ncbi:MAG: heparan-alpha-glucosaminide N-acetyltransferase [Bacilli bacterium]
MKKRIWELDFLRSLAFILMVFDHFTFDLAILETTIWWEYDPHFLTGLCNFAITYRDSDFSMFIRIAFISGVFIFISGICGNLSRNNFKRGIKLGIIAILLTVITFIFSKISGIDITIWFGILHLLSVGMLLTPLFMKIPKIANIIIAVVITGLGIFFGTIVAYENIPKILMIFNFKTVSSADYYPIFPFLGIYIIGLLVGSIVYKNKESLFPNTETKYISPLLFIGRHSLIFYFVHQIILFVIIYALGLLFII